LPSIIDFLTVSEAFQNGAIRKAPLEWSKLLTLTLQFSIIYANVFNEHHSEHYENG